MISGNLQCKMSKLRKIKKVWKEYIFALVFYNIITGFNIEEKKKDKNLQPLTFSHLTRSGQFWQELLFLFGALIGPFILIQISYSLSDLFKSISGRNQVCFSDHSLSLSLSSHMCNRRISPAHHWSKIILKNLFDICFDRYASVPVLRSCCLRRS